MTLYLLTVKWPYDREIVGVFTSKTRCKQAISRINAKERKRDPNGRPLDKNQIDIELIEVNKIN